MKKVIFIGCLCLVLACGGGKTSTDATSSPDQSMTPDIHETDISDSGVTEDQSVQDTVEPSDTMGTDEGVDVPAILDIPEDVLPTDEGSLIEDTFQPPTLPPEPQPISVQTITPSAISVQLEESGLFMCGIGDEGRLIQTENATKMYKNNVYLDADIPPGQILSVTDSGPKTLFGMDNGLVVYEDGFFFNSPITELLPETNVTELHNVDETSFWLRAGSSILSWESDELFEVTVENLPWVDPILSYGALYDGSPALWIADDGYLMALLQEEDEYVAIPVLENHNISHLTSDKSGHLWAISEGTLIRRSPEGEFDWYSHTEPMTGIAKNRHTDDLWIQTNNEIIWYQNGVFAALEGSGGFERIAVLKEEQVLVSDETQTVLISLDGSTPIETIGWVANIAPIYEEKCSMCHSSGNIASDLSTYENWQSGIEEILFRVVVDMPADDPPLDPALVEVIQGWKDGGMLP